MAVLKKVELKWASFDQPDNMSGKYQVDVVNLTPAQVKQLEAENVPVSICDKEGEHNRGSFVTMRSNYPIRVVDASKKDMDGSEIGNGTIANVSYTPFDWTFKKKKGTSAGVNAVQVLKLVKYTSGIDDFEEEEELAGSSEREDAPDFDEDDEIPF